MKKNYLIILSVFCMTLLSVTATAQKQFSLKTPNGNLEAIINIGNTVDYSVSHNDDQMLDKSAISMTLDDDTFYGKDAKSSGSSTKTADQTISTTTYKCKQIVVTIIMNLRL